MKLDCISSKHLLRFNQLGPEARARSELISSIFCSWIFADESQLQVNKLSVALLSKNTKLAYDTRIPALWLS